MTTAIRNYLYCDADFDREGGWKEDTPDESEPPGRDLIDFLRAALLPETGKGIDVWNEEGYGWSFNCERDGITINVLVQFVDRWLVICHVVSFLPQFLRSSRYETALLAVRDAIDRAVRTDTRFRDLRWFTADEYAKSEMPL